MLVILLTGIPNSGKDTVASILCDEFGFVRVAMGDILKEDVSKKTGIPLQYFHDRDIKDSPFDNSKNYRTLLIDHAREARQVDNDIYVRQVMDKIRITQGQRFVVSDWRYQSEELFLRKRCQVTTIRVVRSVIPIPDFIDLNMPVDKIIHNTGTLADLRSSVRSLNLTLDPLACPSVTLVDEPVASKSVHLTVDLSDGS
jgi:hypothetical protein